MSCQQRRGRRARRLAARANGLVEPFREEPLADARDSAQAHAECVRRLLIGSSRAVGVLVNEQQGARVADGASVSASSSGEAVKASALVLGKTNSVLGGHGDRRRCGYRATPPTGQVDLTRH